MKAKKLIATFLAVCMIVSAIPTATFMASAEYDTVSADKIVECTSINTEKSPADKTQGGAGIETENISTENGSVAVYDIDFGADTYKSMQIYYAGRSTGNRCPQSANANIYLGDYFNDKENCVLLGNIKLKPYSDGDNWNTKNFSTFANFEGLTGTETISVQYIGEDGYTAVANARQMMFYKNDVVDLGEYVDITTAAVVSGSNSKTYTSNEGPQYLFKYTPENKMGINPSGNVDITFQTTQAVKLNSYTFFTANDSAERDPKSWIMYGSNDGVTYTAIDTVSDFAATDDRRTYCGSTFACDAPAEYTYYKMSISAFKGSATYFQFTELRLYGELSDEAALIENVKSLITAVSSKTALSADYYTAIDAAESAYEALSDAQKLLVTNYSQLNIPLHVKAAYDALGADDAKYVYDLTNQLASYLPITYKSKNSLTTIADICSNAVTAKGADYLNTYVVGYSDANVAETTYNSIVAAFNFTATNNRPGSQTTYLNGWLATCSDDIWNATRADVVDTVKYQYVEKCRNIGFTNGGTSQNFSNWMSDNNKFYYIPFEGSDDNYNSQEYKSKFTSVVTMFPGMAFSLESAFAQSYRFQNAIPVGEYFDWNGKTYQVTYNGTWFHDVTTSSSSTSVPSITAYGWHPDERTSSSETAKYIFSYAYAKYSQANRWTGLTLGVPQSDYATASGDKTRSQHFNGPQGSAYLITTTDMIDAAPALVSADDSYTTAMDASYIVVNGSLATAIDGVENFFVKAGDYVSHDVDAGTITFANGVLSADGFVVNVTEEELQAMADVTIALINEIGTISTIPNEAELAKIVAAEASYSGLLDGAKNKVSNYQTLLDARAQYDANVAVLPVYAASNITPISGKGDTGNEDYRKLIDGDLSTKLYMNDSSAADTVFSTAAAINVVGYKLTTGNDTEKNPGRNPYGWTIYGSDDGENWTVITNVDNTSDTLLPKANTATTTFYIPASEATGETYNYFKIHFERNGGTEGSGKFQMAEFQLIESKQTADYTAVNAAMNTIPANLSIYSDSSVATLNTAIAAANSNMSFIYQTEVDAYADAIDSAVKGLIKKTVEMQISISEGMVVAADTAGKYNITWNADIIAGDGTSVTDINSAGVVFKEYGVYYAASNETLADYKNASADEIRQRIIDNGEDITVYTMFGFRLKNVNENATRAAMFYIEYEYEGNNYIVLSTIDGVTVIAE